MIAAIDRNMALQVARTDFIFINRTLSKNKKGRERCSWQPKVSGERLLADLGVARN